MQFIGHYVATASNVVIFELNRKKIILYTSEKIILQYPFLVYIMELKNYLFNCLFFYTAITFLSCTCFNNKYVKI
jgi:hypothetical protein